MSERSEEGFGQMQTMENRLRPLPYPVLGWFLAWTLILAWWSRVLCMAHGQWALYPLLLLLGGAAGIGATVRYRWYQNHTPSKAHQYKVIAARFSALVAIGIGAGLLLFGFSLYGVFGGVIEVIPHALAITGLAACAVAAFGPGNASHWVALALSLAGAICYQRIMPEMLSGGEVAVFWMVRGIAVGAFAFWFLLLRELLPRTPAVRVTYGVAAILAAASLAYSLSMYGPAVNDQLVGQFHVRHAESLFWSRDGQRVFAGGSTRSGDRYVLYEFNLGNSPLAANAERDVPAVAPERIRIHEFEASTGQASISPDGKTLAISLERPMGLKESHLVLYDLQTRDKKVIHRYVGSIYFPFTNEGDPWSVSGKNLLYYTSLLAAKEAYAYNIESGTSHHLGSGRNWVRAFWLPADRICFAPEIGGTAESATAFALLRSSDYTGQDQRSFIEFPRMSLSYYYYPDQGKLVVSGGGFTVWDVSTGKKSELALSNMKFVKTVWSPDGKRMASPSESGKSLQVFDTTMSEMRTLDMGEDGWVDSVVWSLPKDAIVFRMGCDSKWVKGNAILMMDPATWEVRRLASTGADSRGGGFLRGNRDFLELSPTRDRLVFLRRSQDGGVQLYLIDLRKKV